MGGMKVGLRARRAMQVAVCVNDQSKKSRLFLPSSHVVWWTSISLTIEKTNHSALVGCIPLPGAYVAEFSPLKSLNLEYLAACRTPTSFYQM
jgi:hypothetical protein